jgi:hypothetical protein
VSRRTLLAARLARVEATRVDRTMAVRLESGRTVRLRPEEVLTVMSDGLPWMVDPGEQERPAVTPTVRLLAQAVPDRYGSLLMTTATSVARALVESEAV